MKNNKKKKKTKRKLQKEYEELLLILAKGKEKEFLKGVNEIHSIAAGLKCWCGWWASDSLETFRRCMGGHGYSSYSSIPSLIDDWGVLTQGLLSSLLLFCCLFFSFHFILFLI